jgi:hypothetical protein
LILLLGIKNPDPLEPNLGLLPRVDILIPVTMNLEQKIIFLLPLLRTTQLGLNQFFCYSALLLIVLVLLINSKDSHFSFPNSLIKSNREEGSQINNTNPDLPAPQSLAAKAPL